MIRNIVMGGAAGAALACLVAQAQETPELLGAPGYRAAEQARQAEAQRSTPAATDQQKTAQPRQPPQGEAQRAEQARIAKQAEEFRTQQAKLDTRAKELADEEQRLERLRKEVESKQTELARLREDAEREQARHETSGQEEVDTADLSGADRKDRDSVVDEDIDRRASPPGGTRRQDVIRADFDVAERSCTLAAQERALERDYYSARYESAPRAYRGRGLELRGRMRLEDRRGYLLIDTVCEVDADGETRRFAFLR